MVLDDVGVGGSALGCPYKIGIIKLIREGSTGDPC